MGSVRVTIERKNRSMKTEFQCKCCQGVRRSEIRTDSYSTWNQNIHLVWDGLKPKINDAFYLQLLALVY